MAYGLCFWVWYYVAWHAVRGTWNADLGLPTATAITHNDSGFGCCMQCIWGSIIFIISYEYAAGIFLVWLRKGEAMGVATCTCTVLYRNLYCIYKKSTAAERKKNTAFALASCTILMQYRII